MEASTGSTQADQERSCQHSEAGAPSPIRYMCQEKEFYKKPRQKHSSSAPLHGRKLPCQAMESFETDRSFQKRARLCSFRGGSRSRGRGRYAT